MNTNHWPSALLNCGCNSNFSRTSPITVISHPTLPASQEVWKSSIPPRKRTWHRTISKGLERKWITLNRFYSFHTCPFIYFLRATRKGKSERTSELAVYHRQNLTSVSLVSVRRYWFYILDIINIFAGEWRGGWGLVGSYMPDITPLTYNVCIPHAFHLFL